MAGLPYFDARLQLALPEGIHGVLLIAFIGLGLACLIYTAAARNRPWIAATVHIAGGGLSLLAEDWVTLLIGWELLSLSAFFLIAGAGNRRALRAAWRYLVFQIAAAAALFVGMAVQVTATGSWSVAVAVPDAQPWLLAAIAIKTAAIPLHGWLVDGYPAAPWPVAPLLSVYATKVGVYTAARTLNLPPVALLGALMAVGGVIGALGQRTGRRLLSYHIISQVGYMIAGVGLATGLGITAGVFHAVNHILYKALLFMVMGAVLLRSGHDRLDQLGGLARAMPLTFIAGVIASASIAGVPPFNGFASKELLKAAAGPGPVSWLLTAATIGTGLSFIKFMTMIFLRPRPEPYPPAAREAPAGMLIPMGLLAVACIATGLWPSRVAVGVEHAYFTPVSVAKAVVPLAASVICWWLFRKKLLAYRPTPAPAIRRTVRRIVRRIRDSARATHDLAWQTMLAAVFAVWLAVVFLLS